MWVKVTVETYEKLKKIQALGEEGETLDETINFLINCSEG